MNENSTSDNIENDDFLIKNEESGYKNLIARLKEIGTTIALLRKNYLDKF